MKTLGQRLDHLVAASHYAAMNGERNAENELNEIDELLIRAERSMFGVGGVL